MLKPFFVKDTQKKTLEATGLSPQESRIFDLKILQSSRKRKLRKEERPGD